MSITNNPPTEFFYGIEYNPSFFSTNSGISLSYGTENYLSRINTASSIASSTTFSGIVNTNNGLSVTGGAVVDTLNASTSLSVGGANINTIYQTIANMVNYLTIATASSTYLSIATASSTYQTIASMINYALLASPTFTGIPKAPTAGLSTNTTQIASCAFVLANTAPNILPLTNTFTGTSNTFNNKIILDGLDTSIEILGFNNFTLTSIANNQIYN